MKDLTIFTSGTVVCKISGLPFKNAMKTAIVKSVVSRVIPSAPVNGVRSMVERLFYDFVDQPEGYVVEAGRCQAVEVAK